MKTELPIEQLLRWRLSRAEAEAPRAPRGSRLLEVARPWWEVWPERFQSLAERVNRIQIAYGRAMAESGHTRSGYPVPAVIVQAAEELETSVCVLYLNVRDRRLHFRFQLDATTPTPESFEVTFLPDKSTRPMLSAQATLSVDREYRIDAELSEELSRDLKPLKVTQRMPFRLILRSGIDGG
jgi:hypothetical protein